MGPKIDLSQAYMKLFFSEYGHVAYQIEKNEAYIHASKCFALAYILDPLGIKRSFFLYCE